MILGAPCAHRAPGVGDFPWGPRRLVAVPVAPPAPRRRPVRPEVVARGRSRESRRSASLSCRRQLLLRAAERPARPWSLSLSRLSLSFVRNNLPPQCCRQVPELHTRLRRGPPPTHTCVAADPGAPRPPAAPRSPPGSVPADGRLHVDVSEFHEETAVTFSQLSDELLWDYVDSGEPMCVPGPGSGAGDAGGDVPGAGERCGGGPRPLCPLRSCRQPSGPPQRHRNGAPRAGGRAPACTFAGHRHQACDGRGHLPLVGTARGQDRLSHRLGPGAGAEALAADRSWGHVHSL